MLTLVVIAFSMLTNQVVMSQELFDQSGADTYNGQFIWLGEVYNKFERTDGANGYIEKYAVDKFCYSNMFIPGSFLSGDGPIGAFLIVLVLWLLLGIAVLSDIFAESVAFITSEVSQMEVIDYEGKSIMIGLSVWNPRIANVTLIALGSSAPEIFMSFINTFVDIDEVPSEFGPMVLIGSATFNMLIVIGICILVATEVKRILRWRTFLVTFFWGTFAYFWLFLVIYVISPYEVQSWEAIFTMIFYPLMIYSVWLVESPTKQEKDEQAQNMNKLICKAMLQNKAAVRGKIYVIDLATGQGGDNDDPEEERKVVQYFCTCLGVDNLIKVSVDQLLDVLEPQNPIEQMRYRLGASGFNASSKQSFARLNVTQQEHFKFDTKKPLSEKVGFKSARYTASENEGYVTLTIVKRCKDDFSFWVRTKGKSTDRHHGLHEEDDFLTAIPGEDYEPLDQLITMKGENYEKDIDIKIIDDDQIEPDEYFQVELLDETTRYRLEGRDTICTVEILDDDRPGVACFTDTVFRAEPNDTHVNITLKRKDGAKGEVSCKVTTLLEHHKLDEEDTLATPDKDFLTFKDKVVHFYDCQTEASFNIVLPSSTLLNEHGKQINARAKPVCFVIQMSDPITKSATNDSEKFVLSKRNYARVEIGPIQRNWAQIDHRRQILGQQLYQQDPTWCDQFKFALMFGPTIDENENLIEVGCCEAFVHFLCMPWKLLFAFIPPRRWGGGWLSFMFTFIMIGLISMVLLSVITSMGCVFNIMPCIQAILMVSIGTSLPDYYASKAIAQDKSITYADAAIGSIFGANAINIFIGLGLPWTISSIYYEGYKDEYYFLGFESGADITFCLVMFFVASFLTFMVLYIRRTHFSGELGGNLDGKCFSGIVLFISWALFAVLTIMGCYEVIASRQVFMPASAVIATQTAGVINTNCPRAINVRTEIINNADGTITVSWDKPQQFTLQEEIQACRVQIEAPDGLGGFKFVDVDRYCDCNDKDVFENQECHIPHKYLTHDLDILPCTLLQAQVQLTNRLCQGDWIQMTVEGAQVQGCPAKFIMEESSRSFENVTFNWRDYDPNIGNQCTAIETYQIEYKAANRGEAFRDGETVRGNGSTSSIGGLESCTNYVFRGRSRNNFCYSDYSDFVTIKTNCQPPGRPIVTLRENGDCGVVIQWQAPPNEVHPIRGYSIQIKNRENQWITPQSCATTNMICSLEEFALTNAPFNLHSDMVLAVRVAASNEYGEGNFQEEQLMFLATPDLPRAPVLVQQGTSVISCWKEDCSKMRISPEASGNQFSPSATEQTVYELQYSQDNGEWRKITGIYDQIWPVHDLVVGSNYQFQVIGSNRCGESLCSPRSSIDVATVPGQVRVINSERDGCSLKIYWDAPNNGGSEILQYYVQIQASDNTWRDVIGCGSGSNVCVLPFNQLRTSFNLEINDSIQIRVTAENEKGSGPISSIYNSPITVVGEPNRMAGPIVNSSPQNVGMASISWEQANSELTVYSYELFDFDTRVTYGMILRYDYVGLDAARQHAFQVRAVNECGYGPKSDITYYTTPSAPIQMMPATVTIDQCGARISWEPPSNIVDNSPVSQYKVEVKTKYSNQYSVPDSNCGGYNFGTNCNVDMSILRASPFNLDVGDRIEVRISAFNDYGWSPPSDLNNYGSTVIDAPQMLRAPSVYEADNNSVTITWQIYDSDALIIYDIEYKSLQASSFSQLPSTSQNFITAEGLTPGASYQFRVRARNPCGEGRYSSNLEVQLPSAPQQLREPTVTEDQGCQIHVQWQQPLEDGNSNVIEYRVQIKDSQNYWQNVPIHCGLSSGYNDCTITQETLSQAPFNLSEGDRIYAQYQARNNFGWSEWSPQNTNAPIMQHLLKTAPSVNFQTGIDDQITLTWTTLFDSHLTYDGQYAYELHWDNGNGGTFSKLQDISETSFTLINYDASKTYRFMVRSRNPCGCGPFSNELTIASTYVPPRNDFGNWNDVTGNTQLVSCYDSDPFNSRCTNDISTEAGCRAEALLHGFSLGGSGSDFTSRQYQTKGCYFYGEETEYGCTAYFGLGGTTEQNLAAPKVTGQYRFSGPGCQSTSGRVQARCYASDPFTSRCSNDVTTQAGCRAEAELHGFTLGGSGSAFASRQHQTKGCYFYGDESDYSCQAFFGLGGSEQQLVSEPRGAGQYRFDGVGCDGVSPSGLTQRRCYEPEPFGPQCSNDVSTSAGCRAEALARGLNLGGAGQPFSSQNHTTKGCYYYPIDSNYSCMAFFGTGGTTAQNEARPTNIAQQRLEGCEDAQAAGANNTVPAGTGGNSGTQRTRPTGPGNRN